MTKSYIPSTFGSLVASRKQICRPFSHCCDFSTPRLLLSISILSTHDDASCQHVLSAQVNITTEHTRRTAGSTTTPNTSIILTRRTFTRRLTQPSTTLTRSTMVEVWTCHYRGKKVPPKANVGNIELGTTNAEFEATSSWKLRYILLDGTQTLEIHDALSYGLQSRRYGIQLI